MSAGQRTWIVRLLWLSVAINAVMAVAAHNASDALIGTAAAAGYAVFATEFARRTR